MSPRQNWNPKKSIESLQEQLVLDGFEERLEYCGKRHSPRPQTAMVNTESQEVVCVLDGARVSFEVSNRRDELVRRVQRGAPGYL